MLQIRSKFVTQLACQLNNVMDFETEHCYWLYLLYSPMLLVLILGLAPIAYFESIIAIYFVLFFLVYVQLVRVDFSLTKKCINKVFLRNKGMKVVLWSSARAQWDDVDELAEGCGGCHGCTTC